MAHWECLTQPSRETVCDLFPRLRDCFVGHGMLPPNDLPDYGVSLLRGHLFYSVPNPANRFIPDYAGVIKFHMETVRL